jgi:hypothetical protein
MKECQVVYETSRTPDEIRAHRLKFWGLVAAVSVAIAVGVGCALVGHQGASLPILATASLAFLFGLNTVAYEAPVTGATAPTAAQSKGHNVISAIVTGDGAATSFTITHNWGLTTAQLAAGAFPLVEYEQLLAAGYTAAPLISSKTANAIAFTNTAFTGAGLRVRITRPVPAEVVITPQP